MRFKSFCLSSAAVFALTACASGPPYQRPAASALPTFHAPLPTATKALEDLSLWWQQFDEPLIAELVNLAQQHSPTLGQAQARIAQARANLDIASASLFPVVGATASARRQKSGDAFNTFSSYGGDAKWELDLFGANRSLRANSDALLESNVLQWHQLRVTVAAEIAATLINYRSCRANTLLQEQDLRSRQQTEQLTQLKIKAGFTAPADGNLLLAALADARQRLAAQRADCELYIKAMVALSGLQEDVLRTKLAAGETKVLANANDTGMQFSLPQPRDLLVLKVPAQVLAQRPDIAALEREMAAAHAAINNAEAARWPQVTLTGDITLGGLGFGKHTNGWSFGPGITLPLFNGGRLRANIALAQARYNEATENYRQQVTNAVREIEEALVRLDSSHQRFDDAVLAAQNYSKFLAGTQSLYQSGGSSLLDLESARRELLNARLNQLNVQKERVLAWITLYKALGGGWQAASKPVATGSAPPSAGQSGAALTTPDAVPAAIPAAPLVSVLHSDAFSIYPLSFSPRVAHAS